MSSPTPCLFSFSRFFSLLNHRAQVSQEACSPVPGIEHAAGPSSMRVHSHVADRTRFPPTPRPYAPLASSFPVPLTPLLYHPSRGPHHQPKSVCSPPSPPDSTHPRPPNLLRVLAPFPAHSALLPGQNRSNFVRPKPLRWPTVVEHLQPPSIPSTPLPLPLLISCVIDVGNSHISRPVTMHAARHR
jgi:hypothetical protein